MADTPDRILERVRKLLALGNNEAAAEGERDNALRMAHKLLVMHNLQLADVELAGTAGNEARGEQVVDLEAYPWARTICHAIAKLFFCSYYFQRPVSGKKGRHYFVGKLSNSTTASELAVFVVRSVLKESVRLYRSGTSPEACAFDKGAAQRIWQRCYMLRKEAEEAEKAQQQPKPGFVAEGGIGDDGEPLGAVAGPAPSASRALVLASLYESEEKANQQWIDDNVGALKKSASRERDTGHRSAYAAGSSFGSKVNLTPSIGQGKKAPALR